VTATVQGRDPHHDGSPLYRPEPPVLGARIPLRVRVPHAADGRPQADHVVLRSVRDGEPHVVAAEQDGVDEAGTWWRADLHVHNPMTPYRFLLTDGRSRFRWLNAAGVHERDVTDAADFRISTEHELPEWVADQVGYQVFPDRFERTETGVPVPSWALPADWDDPVVHQGPDVPFQLYGGTLDGIARRLGHLGDLGATLLYLTPVFEAWSNHRYDAVSFERVDPLLGGDAALVRLLEAAHAVGIRVVGDLTTNHTGDHHDWFELARADPTSAERGFYRFGAGDDADTYVSWLDIASLPKLDHSSVELASRLYDGPDSVVARWLREGFDGWRVDVANMTGRLGPDDLKPLVDNNWDKPFVAGVIDVKSLITESKEEVAERIRAVMEYVPIERLGLSTDCGLPHLPRMIAQNKLKALAEGAEIVRNEHLAKQAAN